MMGGDVGLAGEARFRHVIRDWPRLPIRPFVDTFCNAMFVLVCLLGLSGIADACSPGVEPDAASASETANTNAAWLTEFLGVPWIGEGSIRLLVRVDPVELGERTSDELPAEIDVDLAALLGKLGFPKTANLASVQVTAFDKATDQPIKYANYLYPRSEYDRPFRWYDGSIPYEFSEVFAPSSSTDGERRRIVRKRGGYMYNALGDWQRGHLAWLHTQQGQSPSYYAIYFDLLPPGVRPQQPPPRAWLGDAMPRHDSQAGNTTSADHTHIALDDWNDDGLIDIVYGEQYGQLFVMPNTGTRTAPKFPFVKMLFDADGMPLDVGIHAAPLVVDWDGDGARDLLVGTYRNRVSYFRNAGDNRDRRLIYEGFLKLADGSYLSLPIKPVAAKSEGVFREDYYPVLDAVDWNADGKLDLLAGGYITGRIYFYENVSEQKVGPPLLELRGPVVADGTPINVRDWCAAPCVVDLNGDGRLDLISGSYTWQSSRQQRPHFLRYYQNKGSRLRPLFTERPFPMRGEAVQFRVPAPRAHDFNSDGLVDLVVSSGSDIYLYPNIGTRAAPLFEMHKRRLPATWGNAPLNVGHQLIDWNRDGWIDLVSGYTVHLNSRRGNPYRFAETASVLPPDVFIEHPSGIGDGHFWPYLIDFDRDGMIDVLFGDWYGHVWFHRNLSEGPQRRFDTTGRKLKTNNDRPIKVGPIQGDINSDFTALQGARTTLVAGDYDQDGLDDLIVGDTYGIIRYYKNLGPIENPQFAAAVTVGNLKVRLTVEKADWDGDGRLDVMAGVANHQIHVFLNTGQRGQARFDQGRQLPLPHIKGPSVRVADLNRDGDEDLMITGTQGTTFVERSFLRHGYAKARLLTVQRRKSE